MSSADRKPEDFEMNEDRQRHLSRLTQEIVGRVAAKYVKGQEEHGFDLWRKGGLLEAAIDEAIDQLVYLLTIKEQQQAEKAAHVPPR